VIGSNISGSFRTPSRYSGNVQAFCLRLTALPQIRSQPRPPFPIHREISVDIVASEACPARVKPI